MQLDSLNVFDFDGTLIKINSFREINKQFLLILLKQFRMVSFLTVVILYIGRRCGVFSHLAFKRLIVNVFERALAEQDKESICQAVFDKHINEPVFNRMADMNDCIICTTAPFAYMSRLSFGKEVIIISSLDPINSIPDKSNFGLAKVENLKAYFKGKDIRVANFFTDSRTDDAALIDFSQNAFVVEGYDIKRIK
jgi:hypothetical protein